MKWIRWKYVLPRLVLVLLTAAGFRWGLDPLLKWTLVTVGESAVGAKVEVASIESSLAAGTIQIHDLCVANPNAALKNLLEAEYAQLQLDMDALSRRRFVIKNGLVTGIQLGTHRTRSGILEKRPPEATDEKAFLSPWIDSVDQALSDWLDQFDNRLSNDFAAELKTPQVAQELEQRWPQQYEDLTAQIKNIKSQGQQLEQDIRKLRKNPFRYATELQALQTKLATAQQDLLTLQQEIAQIPQQAEADRQSLQSARQEDEQFLRQKLQIADLDQDGLTQTLLGEPTSQALSSALEWLAWVRNKVPSGNVHTSMERSRGTQVLFTAAQPRYLIQHLQLTGTALWAGQNLDLKGELHNACSEPQWLSEPMRLELAGSGKSEVSAVAILDRRNEVAEDNLEIACRDFSLPGQIIGNSEKLALEIMPSLAYLHVDLSISEDNLQGEIVLSQQSISLKPIQSMSHSKQLVATLDQALGNLEQWEASVKIVGTLQKPHLEIRSDLGKQVAQGMQIAIKDFFNRRKDALLEKTNQEVAARMQRLQKIRNQAQQELLASLGESQEIFNQLATLSPNNKSGLTIPKLSKSLRSPSLFKK